MSIYLDANGTTLISESAKNTYMKWISSYNPSSSSIVARDARNMMERAKKYICAHNNIALETHEVIFTSGATESNITILRQAVDATHAITKTIPHVISSEVEHASTLLCLEDMKSRKQCTYTLVRPTLDGIITAEAVNREIARKTPCLVSIMYANNETGAINEIKEISELCTKRNIPFHVDAVQAYGKYAIDISKYNITALSASFHKLYGPKGVGLLILDKRFIEGYKMHALIAGHQQSHLRGGTENVAGIASSVESIRSTFKNRDKKNASLLAMKEYIIATFKQHYRVIPYAEYKSSEGQTALVLFGHASQSPKFVLCNTILLAIVTPHKFCNVEFRKILDKANVVVSIASNCLTSSARASHVIHALNAPPEVRRGVLRISIGDNNTGAEIKLFCRIFLNQLDKYLRHLENARPAKRT